MYGFIAGLLLAVGMVWLVLDPILRPGPRGDATPADDAAADPDDDLTPRAVALRALSEIEFDRATGKLSAGDYESLKARYTRDAVDALRAPQAVAPAPVASAPLPPSPPPAPLASPVPARASAPAGAACPVHGPVPARGAVYCPTCGRRLGGAAAGYCGACGQPLEADSAFCGRCGSRVAA
ncbi:MAG TPA: hypothetical protein VMC86_05785 [Gemmatimonadales bacterium]|nr:hypothetical protein [Gemmatimonadales bacterium]